MHRRTRKVNPKPRWRRLGPRWKPSLPTGGSTGARKSWDRRTPIFALARSGRIGTTPARAEAGASSRNVARRAVPAELKHRRSSFLPPDVPATSLHRHPGGLVLTLNFDPATGRARPVYNALP